MPRVGFSSRVRAPAAGAGGFAYFSGQKDIEGGGGQVQYLFATGHKADTQAPDPENITVYFLLPKAVTVKNLQVLANNNLPGGQSLDVTVRKDGVDQTLTCNVAGGTASCGDSANSFSANAGQKISVKVRNPGAISTATELIVAVQCE